MFGKFLTASAGLVAYTLGAASQVVKEGFIEFPITVWNTATSSNVTASFSLIQDHLSVNPWFSSSYIPQAVYNLFATQNCSPVGSYDTAGYNFVFATDFVCNINDILPAANVAPGLSWCPELCSFGLTNAAYNCFNGLVSQGCEIVATLQSQQDHKDMLIVGTIVGATAVACCVGFGFFACRNRNRASAEESMPINDNSAARAPAYNM